MSHMIRFQMLLRGGHVLHHDGGPLVGEGGMQQVEVTLHENQAMRLKGNCHVRLLMDFTLPKAFCLACLAQATAAPLYA